MGSSLQFDAKLLEYVTKHTPPEPELFRRLREETEALGPISEMQISWIQGNLMQLLARLIRATRYLEIGVFTGYSTLAMATALPDDGRITALDIDENWTAMGKRYWREAGVDGKIDLILGDACTALEEMVNKAALPPFDMAFIDADKPNMPRYFDYALRLLRPGGLVIVDNVLWSGAVIDPAAGDENTAAIRAFNEAVMKDQRAYLSMIPVGDGLMLACKK
ncbi:MAG: class I SAM-dependent methyltransferase [Proteobacteria bacterium]|nr:class I SAM-dependent methyltransferase [Pseudomonadota bacterium]